MEKRLVLGMSHSVPLRTFIQIPDVSKADQHPLPDIHTLTVPYVFAQDGLPMFPEDSFAFVNLNPHLPPQLPKS